MSIKIGEKKILRSPLEPKDRNWLWLKTVAGFPVLHEYLSGKWVPFSDATAEYVEANILSRVFGSTRYDKAGHCIEFYAADGSDIPIGVIDMSEFEIPLATDDYYTKDEVEDFVAEYVSEHGGTVVDLSGYYTSSEVDAIASGKVDIVSGKGLSSNDYTDAEQIKLAGLENYDDSALQTAIGGKVDKESGKSLMTDAERTKLQGIAAGAEVNVQSDWNQTTTSADDYIKNKPTLATVATSGSYNDLSNKPTIPDTSTFATKTELNGKQDTINDLASIRINSGKGVADMSSNADGTVVYTLANGDTYTLDLNHEHPQYVESDDLADVATSGSYNDLTDKPTIPSGVTVDSTITQGGTNAVQGGAIYTALQGKADTADIPTKTSDLTNDSGFTSNAGTITGITMNNVSKGTSGVVDLGTVITAHQDISGKANASEMAVSTSNDQTTITLKTGTSATVINQHQSLSGYAKYVLLADEAAYTALATKDSGTLYLIPES